MHLPLHLVFSNYHSLEVSRERCRLIVSRSQWIARLLSVLTTLWIGVDCLTTAWPLWGILAIERLVAAAGFLALSRRRFADKSPRDARYALGTLVGIAAAFLILANVTLRQFNPNDHSLFATTAYFYSPFIIAAGLSIFPLIASEVALLAALVVGGTALSVLVRPELLDSASALATMWQLIVVAGIAGLAAMSQLQFLIDVIEQSARDGVTRALTRKYGEQLLDMQFAVASRNDQPLSVLFIDLDRFKSVNDRFGHEAGDAVLRKVAQSLHETLRRQDTVIRWGGEEFLVLLPETDGVGAANAVGRIAKASLGRLPDGSQQKASIGIAERRIDNIFEWPDLASLADSRMYLAKQAGRNAFVGCDGKAVRFMQAEDPRPSRAGPLINQLSAA